MDATPLSRRSALKAGIAALAFVPMTVFAAKNEPMRKALKYQDTPKDGKDCKACQHFVAGKVPTGPGGCKLFPQDTEVVASGWCTAWSKKA